MTTERPDLPGLEVLDKAVKSLTSLPGIYRMIDKTGKILYIGKAKNIKKRVSQYRQINNLPNRLQRMVAAINSVEIMTTESEKEALLLEANLIKKHRPPYNILLRDDKTQPFILITDKDEYPRIMKHRGAKRKEGKYFGPYASSSAVNQTMTILQKAFLLRSCNDHVFYNRSRPCLLYQIKRCSAPCVHRISDEDYEQLVKESLEFLEGKSRRIQKELSLKMQRASQNMEYEQAAAFRDRIRALNHIQSSQDINVEALGDTDLFTMHAEGGVCCIQVCSFRGGRNFGNQTFFPGHYKEDMELDRVLSSFVAQYYTSRLLPKQIFLKEKLSDQALLEEALYELAEYKVSIKNPARGQKHQLLMQSQKNTEMALARQLSEKTAQKKMLGKLQDLFKIDEPVERVEIYDNSHISGTYPYGVMVVATADGFNKNEYRKFKIKQDEDMSAGDDYAMMRQVFKRRFSKALEDEAAILPNLIIVDGGKGQLSSACKILADLGLSHLTITAMSKGPDRNAGREVFHLPDGTSFDLAERDPILYFLQKLRDESHRFAIGSHRMKRKKEISHSRLDDIAGIGAKRKKKLLLHFGSAKSVENAKVSEIEQVEGISKKVAQMIYDAFHNDE